MLEELAILFGGGLPKIFVGQMSTGASNDFERATQLARGMVTKYGMSIMMGTMVVYTDAGTGYGMHSKTISETTRKSGCGNQHS